MEIDNQDDHATAPGTPDSESDTDVDLRELFVVKMFNETFPTFFTPSNMSFAWRKFSLFMMSIDLVFLNYLHNAALILLSVKFFSKLCHIKN